MLLSKGADRFVNLQLQSLKSHKHDVQVSCILGPFQFWDVARKFSALKSQTKISKVEGLGKLLYLTLFTSTLITHLKESEFHKGPRLC